MSNPERTIYSGRTRLRACALVFREDNLLLVQLKAPTREDPIWMPPGGGIEFGETTHDAVKREVFEETGLKVRPLHLAAVHEFVEPPYHAVELYFLSEITGGNLKVGTDPELAGEKQQILRCEFIEIKKIAEMPVFPSFVREIDHDWVEQEIDIRHFITG